MHEDVPSSITMTLPEWVHPFLRERVMSPTPSLAERMDLVLALGQENVRRGTGGPFAATVHRIDDGRLISVGVNLVVPASVAIAHAEVVAIAMAGRATGRFDLLDAGPHEIIASSEPCAMCVGAIRWSGVRRVVFGARDDDCRAVGFDASGNDAAWMQTMEARGVEVVPDILRERAVDLMRSYVDGGGTLFNRPPDRS